MRKKCSSINNVFFHDRKLPNLRVCIDEDRKGELWLCQMAQENIHLKVTFYLHRCYIAIDWTKIILSSNWSPFPIVICLRAVFTFIQYVGQISLNCVHFHSIFILPQSFESISLNIPSVLVSLFSAFSYLWKKGAIVFIMSVRPSVHNFTSSSILRNTL
jgi:hypothetical protein